MRVISYYWIHPDDGMPQIDKTERSKESSKEKRRRFYVTDKRRKNMKNSNLFKKFAAIVVSAMMVLTTFAMPTFGAGVTDGTTIRITGIDDNKTVNATAYKVIKQDDKGDWINMYPEVLKNTTENGGTLQFQGTSGDAANKFKGDVSLTEQQIADLAKAAKEGTFSASKVEGDFDKTEAGVLKKELPNGDGNKYGTESKTGAGMYIVLLENTATGEGKTTAESTVRVYNPLILSIGPTGASGALQAGEVGVGEKYNNTGNVKSSKPSIDKYIARKIDVAADANKSGITGPEFENTTNLKNTYATGEGKYGDSDTSGGDNDSNNPKVGSKVWFEISTTIPAYADNFWYTSGGNNYAPKFKIYDTLSEGLDLQKNTIEVYEKSGDDVTLIDASKYTLEAVDTAGKVNTFTIDFKNAKPDTILGPQREIIVKYAAVVNANCKENFDAERNTARMEYTHKPGEEQSSEQITTYHYTFSINGKINGEGSTELREVVKVGCDDNGAHVFAETEHVANKWKEDIEGATFNLYQDNNGQPASVVYRTAYSDADGRLVGGTYKNKDYTGLYRLDAGRYWLVEQSVPSPYKVNDTPILVEIKANFNTDGTLCDYEILVGGEIQNDGSVKHQVVAGKYKAEYENEAIAVNGIAADKTDHAVIRKPKSFQGHNGTDWNTSKIAATGTEGTLGAAKPKAPTIARPVQAKDEDDTDFQARVAAFNAEWEDYRVALNKYYKTNNDPHNQAADIRNTETGTLPSTGGIGTVIFTVGGIAIMALALLLLFGGKKKETQN